MRLYYYDAYLREFEARIVEVTNEGTRAYLDRTAFYPSSGGQPFDLGTINGAPVTDVADEGERIAHVVDGVLAAGPARGVIDWSRRFDHMQQHTGQHLLSAVLQELFSIPTVSFRMGKETSTIDVAAPALSTEQVGSAERRANEIVFENRPVTITYEDAASAGDLRKASDRGGTLRIVTIRGLDRSACGGTHVRATGEVGPILLGKLDKIRGDTRIEFVCGHRALEKIRADYESLSRTAQATQGKLVESEKIRKKLSSELAVLRGKQRYASATPDESGLRLWQMEVEAIDDEVRAEAQGFVSGSQALFLATNRNPITVLLAVSPDAGVHAGNRLSELVKPLGGKGGGNGTMAQASLPSLDVLQQVSAALLRFGVNPYGQTFDRT